MSKKFDVVIGNPPYQEEAQGEGTRDTPVYHLFMDAAYEVGTKAVLITPARFLFNAGFTPKAWNEKMLADPHLTVPIYVRDSSELFPGTKIHGGIAVTYRDADRAGCADRDVHGVPRTQHDPAQGAWSQERPSSRRSASRVHALTATRTSCTTTTPKRSSCARRATQHWSTRTRSSSSRSSTTRPTRRRHEYVQVLGVIKNKRVPPMDS